MPHDAFGRELKAGDKVYIPATVLVLHPGPEFCNCSLEFDHVMPGRTGKDRYDAINTQQVEKALLVEPHAKELLAQLAYSAYRAHTGGVSLASGQPIPEWGQMPLAIQDAWRASMNAVAAQIG